MIYYDSHKWWTILMQRKGSVFPRACLTSIPIAILTFVIKYLELEGYYSFKSEGIIKNSAVYSGFSFTISFLFVFRTSMSYNRFWTSATSVNAMKTNWFEAAGSLINFVRMSKGPPEEILEFKHKVVRLFSMLHATALGAIASMRDENFPVIDVRAWKPADIEGLRHREDLEKAQIVYRWITCLVVRHIKLGILNVPPPILTRVFQQMELGMVNFNLIVQIMTIPFPFPFAQLTLVLGIVYSLFTPLVMCTWSQHATSAALFTFICVVGLKSIDLITTELENPFGDDPNDLPVHLFHREFNGQLLLLLDHVLVMPPSLGPSPEFDFTKLRDKVLTRQNESLHVILDKEVEVVVEDNRDVALDGSWQRAHLEEKEQLHKDRLEEEKKEPFQHSHTQMMSEIMTMLHQRLQQGQSSSSTTSPNGGTQSGAGAQFSSAEAAPAGNRHDVFLQRQEKAHNEFLDVLKQIATRIDNGVAAADQPRQQQQAYGSAAWQQAAQGFASANQPPARNSFAPQPVLPPCLFST
eukprot:TRINITY_DN7306_c0_g2_i1.p1 TRINITY_DN7306_c0_g2~~TRINITY_DN7306_c0_g2_i1.p1  ORF type:complete len:523 (-),score=73.54 TRINITY_DN7306_c0_g2_i1:62-1630(-)